MVNPTGNQVKSMPSMATSLALLLTCGVLDDVASVDERSVGLWKIPLEGFLVVVVYNLLTESRVVLVDLGFEG